jgi:DNA polymerase III delta prime subunit
MSTFLEDDTSEQVVGKSPPVANSLWVEKYRPTRLDDYIASPDFKAKVKKWIETNDVPHLLFYGGPGTGKTTLAKLITKSIKCDVLYVNASDERKIDDIRYKVKSFASSLGFQERKIIILDEADYITPDAQAALRNLMEAFSMTTRFILTCNYHERIIDAIVSRCQSFPIYPPTKKDVAATLVNILKQEGVKYDKEGVVALVQAHYPDIRAVIGTAQSSVVDGALVVSQAEILEGDIKTKVVEFMKNSNKRDAFNSIRQLIADNSIREFSDFYTYLYEKVDEFAPNIVGATILALAEAQFQDAQVVDKEICFVAAIYKILHLK